MTAVNSIIPAVLAGNSVLLKHSPRTPLCGEHYQKTFEHAGFPKNVLQSSFVEHDTAAEIIQRPETAFVSFTGSVRGYAFADDTGNGGLPCQLSNDVLLLLYKMCSGRQVQQSASQRSIDVTLELGGNVSAAY